MDAGRWPSSTPTITWTYSLFIASSYISTSLNAVLSELSKEPSFWAHRCGPAEFCIIEVCWRTRSWHCNETPPCLVRVQTPIYLDATSDQPLAFYKPNST